MKTFLNILWHIPFMGFLVALGVAISGVIWSITIIGLPIGLGLFQFSYFLIWPHGNAMVSKSDLEIVTQEERSTVWKVFALIARILYFPFGLIHAIIMTLVAFGEFISLVGIPCGLVIMKSITTYFNPVNKVRVPEAVAEEIERRKGQQQLRNYGARPSETPPPVPSLYRETVVVKVICPNCDERVDEAMSFCPYCGTPLRKKKTVTKDTSYMPKREVEEEVTVVTTAEEDESLRFAPPQYRNR